MKELTAIVLAAGMGTRMRSKVPKVLHPVAGRPMLDYTLGLLRDLRVARIVVVVGHGGDTVRAAFKPDGVEGDKRVRFVTQRPQKGTGHAVICALKNTKIPIKGDLLILSADVPLITKETIRALVKLHRRGPKGRSRPAISMITTLLDDATGYGRVLRNEAGGVARVVEDKDCNAFQKKINEINAGIYLIRARFLHENVKKLGRANAQGEYYLPDLVGMAAERGLPVKALTHMDPDSVMGINNRVELARAEAIMRRRIAERLMLSGVTIIDPENTYIDDTVKAASDATIYPGAHLLGRTRIGEGTTIEEGVRIVDSTIGAHSRVKCYSVVESTRTGSKVAIGPFAHLRPGNVIHDSARIGNFVELKKTVVGEGAKASHLTYLGDTIVGKDVNIGAGVITCNYDGVYKHTTVIGDGAFIGSDSQLVAPVKVGRGAYVGSGTTVTKDVPDDALVTARTAEKVIKGWAKRKRGKK